MLKLKGRTAVVTGAAGGIGRAIAEALAGCSCLSMNFKGVMFSDVPNLFAALGYTNASWTLKCDLTATYVVRLIDFMDRRGYGTCTPRLRDPSVKPQPLLDLSSGYIQRAIDQLPRQGSKKPWKLHQNYVRDLLSLRFGPLDDRALQFERRRERAKAA